MRKLINLGFLGVLFVALSASVAQAVRWVYLGSSNGFEYYVDVDREAVQGSYWSAPIRAESNDGTFVGQVMVDCRTLTYKIQLGNQVFDWQPIQSNSPLSTAVDNVCY